MSEPTDHQRGVLQRVRSVGVLTLLSRVLGLIRDSVMAAQFGNGAISDAFALAFRVPNMARQMFGEGALSTAFLPVFLRDNEQHGPEVAHRTGTAVLLAVAMFLAGVVLIAEVAVAGALWTLNLNYEATLLLQLIAVLTPYLMLICVVAQACAIMHGLGQFSIPALFPIGLNSLWIVIAWSLGQTTLAAESRVCGVAIGVVGLGVVQVLLCVPALRALGFRFDLDWAASRSRIREIGSTMLPVVLGLSITQLNAAADSVFAWVFTAPSDGSAGWLSSYPLTEGTTHALYLGQRMLQFPIGVFGAALGTVIYPVLTLHAARREFDLFREDLTRGLVLVVSIGVPASIGLVLVAGPLTELLFLRGQFDLSDAGQTAEVIAMYAIGVWAACGLLILQRAFYALGDRSTPLRIGLVMAAANIGMNFALLWPLGARGLALATSLASIAQCVVTLLMLQSKTRCVEWRKLSSGIVRTTIATSVMAAAYVGADRGLEMCWSQEGSLGQLLRLSASILVGVAAFLAAARIVGLREPFDLLHRHRAAEAVSGEGS